MGKSSRPAPSTSSVPCNENAPDTTTTSAQRRGGRNVLGCLTCRVRRKKCPDSKGDNSIRCSACVRNALDCLGYPGPSPPWAGRMQRRLRECALRSKLWIELSKGVNRPANAVLDLSFYRSQTLPLELTADELQILNALEWQAYFHAHDREPPPDCPRPEFCESALSLNQLIQHGLLQVQNYEPFEALQYIPDHENPKLEGERMATLESSVPEGANITQSGSIISQPEPSSSGARGGYHRVEDMVPQPSTTPDLVANTRPHAPLIHHGSRSLPLPTRQSLTDAVATPVSGFIRRRDALTIDTLNPTGHISPNDLSFWQPGYQDPSGRHPLAPYSAMINNYSNPSIASTSDRTESARANPIHEYRLPPIQQRELGLEGLPAFSHVYQPQQMHDVSRTIYREALMLSVTPRTRQSNDSPDMSASPSPSPSAQSDVPGVPRYQQADNDVYTGTPATFVSERTWGLNASPIEQQPSPLTYRSLPPFPSNYVREGIAPHESAPAPASSAYPSSSGLSIRQSVPGPRSLATQGGDERSPSPRQLRLLSFQPFPSPEELSE